jgi:hypothetical protein
MKRLSLLSVACVLWWLLHAGPVGAFAAGAPVVPGGVSSPAAAAAYTFRTPVVPAEATLLFHVSPQTAAELRLSLETDAPAAPLGEGNAAEIHYLVDVDALFRAHDMVSAKALRALVAPDIALLYEPTTALPVLAGLVAALFVIGYAVLRSRGSGRSL